MCACDMHASVPGPILYLGVCKVCDVTAPIRVIPFWPIGAERKVSEGGSRWMIKTWGRLSSELWAVKH